MKPVDDEKAVKLSAEPPSAAMPTLADRPLQTGDVPESLRLKFEAGYVPLMQSEGYMVDMYAHWIQDGGEIEQPKAEAEEWAVVELLGHRKLAGRLTEVERFGSKMGRLEIPHGDGFVTEWFTGSSVYCITAVTEAVARQVAQQAVNVAPIQPWDYPKPNVKELSAGHELARQRNSDLGDAFDDDDYVETDDERNERSARGTL